MDQYLAVDIGAKQWQTYLCHIENKRKVLKEIYQFIYNVISRNGHYCWNIEYLCESVLNGIKNA